eukprot:scaffold107447_cov19-Prasinocladus_malaysianus.AAC.1
MSYELKHSSIACRDVETRDSCQGKTRRQFLAIFYRIVSRLKPRLVVLEPYQLDCLGYSWT